MVVEDSIATFIIMIVYFAEIIQINNRSKFCLKPFVSQTYCIKNIPPCLLLILGTYVSVYGFQAVKPWVKGNSKTVWEN